MDGWFQLNCAVHVGKISGVTDEVQSFFPFNIIPCSVVLEGRANAPWATINGGSLKFIKFITYCCNCIALYNFMATIPADIVLAHVQLFSIV